MNADVEQLAAEFCKENGIAVTMSREMPAGYENAYGTYDVAVNTLFLNPAMLRDAPEYEKLYYLYHELRHAVQSGRASLTWCYITASASGLWETSGRSVSWTARRNTSPAPI